MPRESDWSKLGLDGDPTPGDPEVVHRIRVYMELIQGAVTDARNGIGEIMAGTGDGAFVGQTADWLRREIDTKTTTFLNAVADAFAIAAPAMATYEEKLREAQGAADTALTSAQGLADDDPQLEVLKGRGTGAAGDLKTAGQVAAAALDSASHAVNPWAKSRCAQFWDVFFWITLLITIVAIFVGGPLGLLAFAANAVLLVKSVVDLYAGHGSLGEVLFSLFGVLFPSTRAIRISDLVKLIGRGAQAVGRGAASILRSAGGGAWAFFRSISFSTIVKGVFDIGSVIAASTRSGATWIARGIASGGLAARGFTVLSGFSITAGSKAFISGMGVIARSGRTAITRALDAFSNSAFANFMRRELGDWAWLRIFLPMAGDEIRVLGVSGAFKLGVLGRG